MSKYREQLLEHHFGKYETTSLQGRMQISMTKRCFENMMRFWYYVEDNFLPFYEGDEITHFVKIKGLENGVKKEYTMDEMLDSYLQSQQDKLNAL